MQFVLLLCYLTFANHMSYNSTKLFPRGRSLTETIQFREPITMRSQFARRQYSLL